MSSSVREKYFVDRSGVQTRRMVNAPGKGHYDLAKDIVGNTSDPDLYAQMQSLGYIRAMETDDQIHVEAPHALTGRQKRFLRDRSIETGKEVVLNNREFIESKDPRASAQQVVAQLLS